MPSVYQTKLPAFPTHFHFLPITSHRLSMDSRTAETPMEFEWQHRQPGDANSAFYRVGLQHENKKREHPRPSNITHPLQYFETSRWTLTHIHCFIIGNYSAFGSPEKKTIPSLRAPNSHPFLFSHPSSPSPFTSQPASQTPRFGQSAWTTPRKPTEIDFSSGAEFSSPDQADNEDTPEQPIRHQRQNSLFNNRGRFAPNASPGRGEIRKNTYSDAVARRVFKKRRQRDKEIGRRVRVDSDDESDRPSSSEGVVSGKSGKQKRLPGMKREGQVARTSGLSQLFEFLERHPNMPSILSWWAQLMLNVTIFSIAVWVVWSILQSIRSEFNHRAELESGSILTQIHQCAKDYLNNGCESPHRAPALTTLCNDWQKCMDRDPAKVAHAQLSAATMAIIINSFIEPISWKAVVRDAAHLLHPGYVWVYYLRVLCRSSTNGFYLRLFS